MRRKYLDDDTACVDSDGFFSTGDLGYLDDDGFLFLQGRKDNQFKISTGRKILPEQTEQVYQQSPFVDDIVVFGEGQRFIVGLIVPSERFIDVCRQNEEYDKDESLNGDRCRRLMASELASYSDRLEQHLRLADFYILDRPFQMDQGELTATLKPRRSTIESHFDDRLHSMFDAAASWLDGPCNLH